MPDMKKPKVRGKIKKLPFDTDIIMPGRKYPKRFTKQMEEMRKQAKKNKKK